MPKASVGYRSATLLNLDTTPRGKFKMAGASLDIQLEISNAQEVKADPLWSPGFDGVP